MSRAPGFAGGARGRGSAAGHSQAEVEARGAPRVGRDLTA